MRQGTEAALLFGSGYLANVGVLSALVGRGDAVFSDRLNHASIIDGIRLSRATIHRYRALRRRAISQTLLESAGRRVRRKLIVTESVFSMDGDVAPLARARRPCRAPRCRARRGRGPRGRRLRAAGRGLRATSSARGARRPHDRHLRQGVRRLRRLRRRAHRSGSTTSSTPAVRSSSRRRCLRPSSAVYGRRSSSCAEAGELRRCPAFAARSVFRGRLDGARPRHVRLDDPDRAGLVGANERALAFSRGARGAGCSASRSGRRPCPKERRASGCR